MSVDKIYENIINSIEEMIGTSIVGMMGVQPNPVVGQENPSKYQKQNRGEQKSAMHKFNYKKIGKISKNRNNGIEPVVESIIDIMVLSEAIKDICD